MPVWLAFDKLHEDKLPVACVKRILRHGSRRTFGIGLSGRLQLDGNNVSIVENALGMDVGLDLLFRRLRRKQLFPKFSKDFFPRLQGLFPGFFPYVQTKAAVDHGNRFVPHLVGKNTLFPHEIRERVIIVDPFLRIGFVKILPHILVKQPQRLRDLKLPERHCVFLLQVFRCIVAVDARTPCAHVRQLLLSFLVMISPTFFFKIV